MKTIYWVIGVVVVSVSTFIYLMLGDAQKTVPKIKLSYFATEAEIAESVTKILSQILQQRSTFWIGIEPDKTEQLEVVLQLKQQLEKTKPFDKVIVDEELALSKEWLEKFKVTDSVAVKNNLPATGEQLANLEKTGQSYLVITASIYSAPTIIGNQLHQLKEKYLIQPTTFSLAFFPTSSEEEKYMLFPCRTEDHSGTASWGCEVANKSRFTRRKVDQANTKPWIGLMDLIGEKDYMILLKKK
ncbi:MAG: hypothetical protein H7328_08930 [Bdellovibrio sp.]|nr:hypothetical protein [Bdellovibrio sp.]